MVLFAVVSAREWVEGVPADGALSDPLPDGAAKVEEGQVVGHGVCEVDAQVPAQALKFAFRFSLFSYLCSISSNVSTGFSNDLTTKAAFRLLPKVAVRTKATRVQRSMRAGPRQGKRPEEPTLRDISPRCHLWWNS